MKVLTLIIDWTPEQAALVAEFLGDIATEILNKYEFELALLHDISSENTAQRSPERPLTPNDDDLALF